MKYRIDWTRVPEEKHLQRHLKKLELPVAYWEIQIPENGNCCPGEFKNKRSWPICPVGVAQRTSLDNLMYFSAYVIRR